MKRHILLLAIAIVWSVGAVAQNTLGDTIAVPQSDMVDDDGGENVVGGRVVRSRHSGEANILGAPIYYDSLGNVIGGSRGAERTGRHRLPTRHYLNSLENNFCSFFSEAEFMMGPRDVAGGVNLTYLPKRWGAYGSVLFGFNHSYITVGPSLRLSQASSSLDWHLYGGLLLGGNRMGAEVGTRIALPRQQSAFSWSSASVGLATLNGDTFVTFGMSLDLAGAAILTLLLF